MTAFNSKWKYKKLAVVVGVPQNNAEIGHFTLLFCADDVKEMYKGCFVLIAVVVVCLSFLWSNKLARQLVSVLDSFFLSTRIFFCRLELQHAPVFSFFHNITLGNRYVFHYLRCILRFSTWFYKYHGCFCPHQKTRTTLIGNKESSSLQYCFSFCFLCITNYVNEVSS